jgi:hypothetical protein
VSLVTGTLPPALGGFEAGGYEKAFQLGHRSSPCKALLDVSLDLVADLVNLFQNLLKSLQRNFASGSNIGLESLIDGAIHNLHNGRVIVDAS